MTLRPPIGVRLKSSVLTRRDLQHSGSGFALNWPMCPDRHPSILKFVSYSATKLAKLERKCGLASLPRSRPGLGWQCGDPYRSGDSIPALFGLFRALGGRFGAISLFFWGPLLFPYYPYYIPIPPVWLCCIFLFNIDWTSSSVVAGMTGNKMCVS